MRLTLLLIVVLTSGCLSFRPDTSPTEKRVTFFAGVPIVRPGLHQEDVDRFIDGSKAGVSSGGCISYMMWSYSDGLQLDTDCGKVVRCNCGGFTITGSPNVPSPLTDAMLELRLRKGMSPPEVSAVAGTPKYGVETDDGKTEVYYPDPGIAVEYVDGIMSRWRRVVYYKEEASKP